MKHTKLALVILMSCLITSGCSTLYKPAGNTLIGYAKDNGLPYLMTTDDPLMACALSSGLGPLFLSFETVTTPPDQLAVIFYTLTGMCAEVQAWEEELRFFRALHQKNTAEAQDARIAYKRLMDLAAQRELIGYQKSTQLFGEMGGECPDFADDAEQFTYLIGLLNGLQAVFSDVKAGGRTQVPMNVAAKAARGANCVDNHKWWGLPQTIQSAVWITLPSLQPEGTKPYQNLNDAVEIGLQAGLRTAQLIALQIYAGQGKIEQVKRLIRAHADARLNTPADPSVKLLDEMASLQILAISDAMWSEATGKRTPAGKLGTFWDDPAPKQQQETLDIDELL